MDSDKLFLLSLYDRYKSIDNNQKIPAQIEILNVIQRYSKNAPSLSYTPFTNYIPNYNQTQGQSYPHNTYQPPPMNVQPPPPPVNVQPPPPTMYVQPWPPSMNEHEFSPENVLSPHDSVASSQSDDCVLPDLF